MYTRQLQHTDVAVSCCLQVLGLLCRCLALRVLSLPVVPAAACIPDTGCLQQHSLQTVLLQLLLQRALPAAMAAPAAQRMQAAAGEAEQAAAYHQAAGAVLGHGMVQQLVQLLAALQLKTGHAGAALDQVSNSCNAAAFLSLCFALLFETVLPEQHIHGVRHTITCVCVLVFGDLCRHASARRWQQQEPRSLLKLGALYCNSSC